MKFDMYRFHVPGSKALPPCRSLKEMAAEFGISTKSLSQRISKNDGPKPKLKHHHLSGGYDTWYDPIEMRKWWRGLKHE